MEAYTRPVRDTMDAALIKAKLRPYDPNQRSFAHCSTHPTPMSGRDSSSGRSTQGRLDKLIVQQAPKYGSSLQNTSRHLFPFDVDQLDITTWVPLPQNLHDQLLTSALDVSAP
ncbi:hypothetical protein FQY79_10695 [Luteimonas wenzhouensis]|uniref:Uncharacterized protein n=1 Tax=Luteimonas wenzhouensis TaxID=2599615 RepID=A0A5C5TYG0_9GAMM|nr:hypothetical protein FQY79_10695 [Luteimonas wenzhouensis]